MIAHPSHSHHIPHEIHTTPESISTSFIKEKSIYQTNSGFPSLMDSKKCNKIREIVRLQQILKKWKKVANASKNSSASDSAPTSESSSSSSKGIKFLKRTLSFTDVSAASSQHHHQDMVVPKGYLAVCVGEELKRFIIPMDYLRHQAFELLLREAEEEFGFQQEGVLKIPCQVSVFEKILKVVQDNTKNDKNITSCEVTTPTHHAQVYCR